MRTLICSGDSPSAQATTRDASRANKARFRNVARVIATVHIILSLLCGAQKRHNSINVKFWEVIADKLSKAGWSWGWVARPAAA